MQHLMPCAHRRAARSHMFRLTACALALGSAGLAASGLASAAPPGPAAAPAAGDHHAGSGLSALTRTRALPALAAGAVRGLDVSSHQGAVNWASVKAKGASFAYVKATESTTYRNPFFSQQYTGSAGAGLLRGAYHFAIPNKSPGAAQADYFLAHGGGWKADGRTLPGALDIEYNPDHGQPTCYGLGRSAMTQWINSFVERYKARTGRYPAVYSTTDWWRKCTGDTSAVAHKSPLWIANYNGSAMPLPAGWSTYTIWQTADAGPLPGDQNVFNGSLSDLRTFAQGTYTPPPAGSWPVVKEGQSGKQVHAAQQLLKADGAPLAVDGRFGPGTRSAVVAFQKSKHLDADGIVGARTWQALAMTVRSGDTGWGVRAAQFLLTEHGAPIGVDGRFGPGTKNAVVAFQKSKHLGADGIVGARTWQALLG